MNLKDVITELLIVVISKNTREPTGERLYKCEFAGCDYLASQIGNVKSHMRKHTG